MKNKKSAKTEMVYCVEPKDANANSAIVNYLVEARLKTIEEVQKSTYKDGSGNTRNVYMLDAIEREHIQKSITLIPLNAEMLYLSKEFLYKA